MKRLVIQLIVCFWAGISQVPAQAPKKPPEKAPLQIPTPPKKANRPDPFITEADWKSWRDRFASASPLLTLNKAWPKEIEITEQNLLVVLQRKSLVKFTTALNLGDRKFTEYDVTEYDDAVRFEASGSSDDSAPAPSASKEEARFATLVSHMQKLIEKREDTELLILWARATHGIDLFFDFFLKDADKAKLKPIIQRRSEIYWVAAPLSLDTSYQTQDYYDLRERVDGISSKVRRFGDGALIYAITFLSRLYYYQNLLRERLKVSDLKPSNASLGTLVFMDAPQYNEIRHLESLPSAAILKRSGFSRVRLGIEGLQFDRSYSLDFLRSTTMTPQGLKLQDYEVQLLKENQPVWHKRYQEGIIVNPAVHALYQKLRSWAEGGISVSITGLDDQENIGK